MKYFSAFFLLTCFSLLFACGENASSKQVADQTKESSGSTKQQAGDLQLLAQGQEIAMQTQAVLGQNLVAAINAKGIDHALEFCSLQAIALTDSMSQVLHASVKRVSDKNRNPDNAANPSELAYINASKVRLTEGKKLMPKLIEQDGETLGYYPIMTNGLCLQCHGEKAAQVKASTLQEIEEIYPDDLALGYDSDELRGIWVVRLSAFAKTSRPN